MAEDFDIWMVNVATSAKRQSDHREEQQSIHTNYEAQICKFISSFYMYCELS